VWAGATGRAWWVAKKQLVGVVQACLQTGRLAIVPTLQHSDTLKKELLSFQIKVSTAAQETFLARAGAHDDLVLAVALALWLGHEDRSGPVEPSRGYAIDVPQRSLYGAPARPAPWRRWRSR